MKLTELSLIYVNWVTFFIEDDFMYEMHDRFDICWILMSIEKLKLMIYEISWLFDWFKCTLILFSEMYIDFSYCNEYDLS